MNSVRDSVWKVLARAELTPVALTIIDGEVCATGVTLVSDEDENIYGRSRSLRNGGGEPPHFKPVGLHSGF